MIRGLILSSLCLKSVAFASQPGKWYFSKGSSLCNEAFKNNPVAVNPSELFNPDDFGLQTEWNGEMAWIQMPNCYGPAYETGKGKWLLLSVEKNGFTAYNVSATKTKLGGYGLWGTPTPFYKSNWQKMTRAVFPTNPDFTIKTFEYWKEKGIVVMGGGLQSGYWRGSEVAVWKFGKPKIVELKFKGAAAVVLNRQNNTLLVARSEEGAWYKEEFFVESYSLDGQLLKTYPRIAKTINDYPAAKNGTHDPYVGVRSQDAKFFVGTYESSFEIDMAKDQAVYSK